VTITRAHDGAKTAGGTGAITVTYNGVAAGRLALLGRYAWNDTATFTGESGFTLVDELTGGTGTSVDSHTGRTRVDSRELDGSESGTFTPNQGGTVSGAIGVMPVYETDGTWDTIASATGTDNTHGTGRSVTASSSISFQPGDVLVCFIGVDTDAATAWTAQTLAASGITFGGGTVTVHDSTTGGVLTGNDGNIMVLEATVTAGSGTVAPTLTMTGGPSQCGPVVFVRLRDVVTDVPVSDSDSPTVTDAESPIDQAQNDTPTVTDAQAQDQTQTDTAVATDAELVGLADADTTTVGDAENHAQTQTDTLAATDAETMAQASTDALSVSDAETLAVTVGDADTLAFTDADELDNGVVNKSDGDTLAVTDAQIQSMLDVETLAFLDADLSLELADDDTDGVVDDEGVPGATLADSDTFVVIETQDVDDGAVAPADVVVVIDVPLVTVTVDATTLVSVNTDAPLVEVTIS